jgi:eukaryotic-like serine/threonine-protein kinase
MGTRIGSNIGRYEIVAEIGRGGMGVVYQARDPKIDRLVAIKTISLLGQEPDEEQDYRQRFAQEAQAAGRLSHPGIVTIFDVGEEPENREPYIVMEYVAGESLKKMLTLGDHKMPLMQAVQLAYELADALHYAHAEGVIHRDIKPANILVTTGGHPKIADFGIAKLNLSNLTLPGQLLGSPSYMSPEQLNGEGVDARSDLFSLGVVFYTMLTGFRPFQGNSATTVCFKVVNRDPMPVAAFDASLPPELDRILMRAMAKDPAQRYQSAAEMAEAIEGFRRERNLATTGTTTAGSASQWFAGTTDYSKTDALLDKGSRSGTGQTSGTGERPSGAMNLRRWAYAGVLAFLVPLSVILGFEFRSVLKPAALANLSVPTTQPPAAIAQSAISTPIVREPATMDVAPAKSKPVSPRKTPALVQTRSIANPVSNPPAPAATSIMQVEIDHPFKDVSVTIWLDKQVVYQRALHGETKSHAVLFRQVQGHQSDSIPVTSGKHQVRIQAQTPDGVYDQSKTISAMFEESGETVLHVQCAKRGGEMNVTLQ